MHIKKCGKLLLIFLSITIPICAMISTLALETTDVADIGDNLGMAQNFSVFAKNWTQNGHSEGAICVENIVDSNAPFSNSDKITDYTENFTVNVTVNSSPTSTKPFRVALFEKINEKYVMVEKLVKNVSFGETVSFSSLNKKQVHYVFEIDDSNIIVFDNQKTNSFTVQYQTDNFAVLGIETTRVSAINNISYIKHIGKDCGGSTGLYNSYGNSPLIVFGDSVNLYKDGQYFASDSTTGGKLLLGESDKRVVVKDTFPIDFDKEFEKLSSLSEKLSNAKDNANRMILNLSCDVNGNINWEQALPNLGLSDINDISNKGITIPDGKYLVINVKSENPNAKIKLDREVRINEVSAAQWNIVASKVIWNYYSEDSWGKYVPFTGLVNMERSALGTQLAPCGSIYIGHSSCCQLIAKNCENGGEVHFMPFEQWKNKATNIVINNVSEEKLTTVSETTEPTTVTQVTTITEPTIVTEPTMTSTTVSVPIYTTPPTVETTPTESAPVPPVTEPTEVTEPKETTELYCQQHLIKLSQ